MSWEQLTCRTLLGGAFPMALLSAVVAVASCSVGTGAYIKASTIDTETLVHGGVQFSLGVVDPKSTSGLRWRNTFDLGHQAASGPLRYTASTGLEGMRRLNSHLMGLLGYHRNWRWGEGPNLSGGTLELGIGIPFDFLEQQQEEAGEFKVLTLRVATGQSGRFWSAELSYEFIFIVVPSLDMPGMKN